jgi:hypothetical protein
MQLMPNTAKAMGVPPGMEHNPEEYFNDPACKYGYFRGRETYTFVRIINQRFDIYKTKIKP